MKVKILKFSIEENNTRYDYRKNGEPYEEYIFRALVKVKGKKYLFKFMTMGSKYTCAYLQDFSCDKTPEDKEIREAVLIKAYGELKRIIAEWEMEGTLVRQDRERKEEEARKKREEEAKRISLGEQISIDKYLLNRE